MQNHYNLIYREEEREMIPQCLDQGVGVLPWSPLARGLLAGTVTAGGERRTTRARTDPFLDSLYRPDLDLPVIDRADRGRDPIPCRGSTSSSHHCGKGSVMRAVRLHPPGRIEDLRLDELPPPEPHPGQVLVGVHAAGITRDELEWPADRLPAIPSYELSGVVAQDTDGFPAGTEVFALTPFDRDGVAADYALVPAEALAPKPSSLSHVQAAALRANAVLASARGKIESISGPSSPVSARRATSCSCSRLGSTTK